MQKTTDTGKAFPFEWLERLRIVEKFVPDQPKRSDPGVSSTSGGVAGIWLIGRDSRPTAVYKLIFMRAAYVALILLLPCFSWAGENGKFSIQTTPPAMIVVDDIPVHKSPVGNVMLTPGAHKIEYRLDSGKTEEFHLTIHAGRHLICNYDFETTTHPCKEVDLKPVKKAATGSFEAKSNLPADVTLDGKPIGKTPVAKTKISLGKHRLEFRSGDREPVLREFDVNANETVEIEATFDEKKQFPTP